jgi:hypothetical protein
MMTNHGLRKADSFRRREWALVMLAAAIFLPAFQRTDAAPNITVWDTGSRLADATAIESRAGWKVVPSELFSLEADPPKAASDPGYYGREYAFKGDAVVENIGLLVVFWSAQGRVLIYAKEGASPAGPGAARDVAPARKIAEVAPLQTLGRPATISRAAVLRNANDEAVLEVTFSAKDAGNASAVFAFDRTQVLEIQPAKEMPGITVVSAMEYGVAPAFIGDDLIYAGSNSPSASMICVPAEHVLVGLVSGGNAALVMTWPNEKQPVRLKAGIGPLGDRLIESVDFDNSGQGIFLAPLIAPGIWHRENLTPAYLEKDVRADWKRPFPARWKTQLYEADVKTTFAFRESRGQIWRGVPGSYEYPVWFDGDDAFYHLGKKVPPKGESLVYFLEGQDTPPGIQTPVDIMKATLGRVLCEPILDVAGRKLRTHHRRGGDGVHRACTCGCTEAIQAFFEKGEEVARKNDIGAALDDMKYFVHCHVERIAEYKHFADDLIRFLKAQENAAPDLTPYLEGLDQIAQQIRREYSVQEVNMKSPEYVSELTRQTLALTETKGPNNLKAYMELLKAWREMGGAQDYVVAQCHLITRKLSQEAGYSCADRPKAVAVAREIRSRCRQVLRNPDGYEIWANY